MTKTSAMTTVCQEAPVALTTVPLHVRAPGVTMATGVNTTTVRVTASVGSVTLTTRELSTLEDKNRLFKLISQTKFSLSKI